MVMMLILSVPLGMLSALYKDKWIDYLVPWNYISGVRYA